MELSLGCPPVPARATRSRLLLAIAFLVFCAFGPGAAFAQEPEKGETPGMEGDAAHARGEQAAFTSGERAEVAKFGVLAAAIAFAFGSLGAGIAIAYVGSAAMGTIGEKPELASQALIFIALAEGLVVFGFITALMILGKF